MHKAAQDFIRQIGFKFEFGADVIVECGSVRALDICQQWIIFGSFRDAEAVAANEAAVDASDGESAIAQEFLEEMLIVDAQIAAINKLRRETGVTRHL